MTFDAKTAAVFLPFIAAAFYGVAYVMNEKILSAITMPTYILISNVVGACIMAAVYLAAPARFDFAPVLQLPVGGFLVVTIVASMLAWLATLVATREISASYAALGEISYPFFTVLFAFLLFRKFELTASSALGGLLILAGSFVLLSDKMKLGGQ